MGIAFYQLEINLGNSDPVTLTDTVDFGDYSGYSCLWEYEVSDRGNPVRGEENAFGLFNAISNDFETDGTGLDSRGIRDDTSDLRVEYSDEADHHREGQNVMYGDLLCGNADNGDDYAQWHVCHPDQSNKEVDGRDDDVWSCDPQTNRWIN